MRQILVIFLIPTIYSFSLDPTLCTGNKTVNSYQEYLTAFNSGPCNPIVYVPALLGTSLKITADCEVLRKNKSLLEVAFALKECPFLCSWGKKHYENIIWVYETQQWKYMYLNDFNFVWKRRECAFFLIINHYKKISSGDKVKFQSLEIPGLEVKVNGDTKNSKSISNCGERAVESNFGYPSGSYSMMTVWKEMGYINGLSLQAVPFDFRKSGLRNDISNKLKFALKMVTKFTGKKSYLFSHSYGNNNVMFALKNLTQTERDSWVKEFVAVGPPFLGTLQGIFFMLGQNDWLYSPSIEKNYGLKWLSKYFDGVDPYFARKSYPYIDAVYEFFPQISFMQSTWKTFQKNLPFLKTCGFRQAFLQDVEQDIEFVTSTKIVDKAYAKSGEFNDYTLQDLDRVIDDLAFSEFTKEFYHQFDYNSLSTFENPGVSVRVVFLSEVKTISNLTLYDDPQTSFDNGKFPRYKVDYKKGDQTVNLYSLVMAPLVWFSDFINAKKKKNTNDPYESEPREIFFVEFGPGQSKDYSRNYNYVHCDDSPKKFAYDQQGILEKSTYYLSYMLYTTFGFGKRVLEKILSVITPRRYNNYNPKELPDSDFQREKARESGDPLPFGSGTCNHGAIITNPQYLEYITKLLQNSEKSKGGVTQIKDQIYQNHINQCIPVTCHGGFQKCWSQFEELFGFK